MVTSEARIVGQLMIVRRRIWFACLHCETVVELEIRTETIGLLVAHLGIHREIVVLQQPRWAELFDHFRVLRTAPPRRAASTKRTDQA